MAGERYCASTATGEVHDLDNEKYHCRIDQILDAREDSPFTTLSGALNDGHELCPLCLGEARTQSADVNDNDTRSDTGASNCLRS